MAIRYAIILGLSISCLSLSACAPFKPTDKRAAICNELNSRMIFSGSTNINRTAEIQHSERLLLQKNYEKYHCDQK